jgi:hypothetical protein
LKGKHANAGKKAFIKSVKLGEMLVRMVGGNRYGFIQRLCEWENNRVGSREYELLPEAHA